MFQKIWLNINAILFVVFGACFLVIPSTMAFYLTGSSPTDASALVDMRATYAGFSLGIGIYQWCCARNTDLLKGGLLATFILYGCIATSRLVGILVDAGSNDIMLYSFVFELSCSVVSFLALKRNNVVAWLPGNIAK